MGIGIKEIATINDNFKKLIQSGNYENLVLDIINEAKRIFPNKYERVTNQAHGECDFIDTVTLKKYDAKLPFSKKQGQLIGSNNSDYLKWMETMLRETTEFGDYIENRGKYDIEKLTLYKIMRDRLKSVENDEDAIFFFPYTIVLDREGMVFTQFASDLLSAVFSKLKSENLVGERKIYAIYPSIDGQITIRCLNTHAREFIPDPGLNKYISFDVRLIKE